MSNDHRIERISVIDRAEDMVAARSRQSSIARLLQGPVGRAWSRVMDRYAGAEETIHVDRLELRITGWSDGLSDREVERRLVAALEEQLDQRFRASDSSGAASQVQRTAIWQADRWADFLATGRWYDSTEQTSPQAYFETGVLDNSSELLSAWRAAYRRAGNHALERLLKQMPLDRLADWLGDHWSGVVPEAAFTPAYWRGDKLTAAVAERLYHVWLRTVARALAEQKGGKEWPVWFWEDWLAQWPADRKLPTVPTQNGWPEAWEKTARKYARKMPAPRRKKTLSRTRTAEAVADRGLEPDQEAPQTGEYFVTGAGLVLLHPYLAMFFQELGLLDPAGKDFRDLPAREHALQLCHWLVTGDAACAEQETVLYKLLCAWPEGAVPTTDHPLPNDWLEQGEQLLRAVIRNWDKLGDISPEALREGFLQRAGKLGQDSMGYALRVEQRGMDVLLEYLPWGIGIIKLPWMPRLLRVEWT